jgi:hypothetical protein
VQYFGIIVVTENGEDFRRANVYSGLRFYGWEFWIINIPPHVGVLGQWDISSK